MFCLTCFNLEIPANDAEHIDTVCTVLHCRQCKRRFLLLKDIRSVPYTVESPKIVKPATPIDLTKNQRDRGRVFRKDLRCKL